MLESDDHVPAIKGARVKIDVGPVSQSLKE